MSSFCCTDTAASSSAARVMWVLVEGKKAWLARKRARAVFPTQQAMIESVQAEALNARV